MLCSCFYFWILRCLTECLFCEKTTEYLASEHNKHLLRASWTIISVRINISLYFYALLNVSIPDLVFGNNSRFTVLFLFHSALIPLQFIYRSMAPIESKTIYTQQRMHYSINYMDKTKFHLEFIHLIVLYDHMNFLSRFGNHICKNINLSNIPCMASNN